MKLHYIYKTIWVRIDIFTWLNLPIQVCGTCVHLLYCFSISLSSVYTISKKKKNFSFFTFLLTPKCLACFGSIIPFPSVFCFVFVLFFTLHCLPCFHVNQFYVYNYRHRIPSEIERSYVEWMWKAQRQEVEDGGIDTKRRPSKQHEWAITSGPHHWLRSIRSLVNVSLTNEGMIPDLSRHHLK